MLVKNVIRGCAKSLIRGRNGMFVFLLGFTLALASSAFAECPHVGITALASNRYVVLRCSLTLFTRGTFWDVCTLRLFTRSTWPEGLDLSSPIVLNFPLLLDRPSPRLPGIKIVAGGRLVFSPHAADASLTTDFIQVAVFVVVVPLSSFVQIEDGGSLEIGSSECPFEGRAEILLTGTKKTFSN